MVVAGEEPQGLFSLGALESTAAVRIPALLAGYNQRYPKIQFALTTGPSGAMLDGVLEGKLNAAFIDGPLMHPGLEGIPAYQGRDDDRRATRPFRRFAGQRGEWL